MASLIERIRSAALLLSAHFTPLIERAPFIALPLNAHIIPLIAEAKPVKSLHITTRYQSYTSSSKAGFMVALASSMKNNSESTWSRLAITTMG
jgi:hypothetical protein